MPAQLTPTALRCEYLRDPLGIDVPAPRLSWALSGDGRGRGQSAFRILVASDHGRLKEGAADVWDSGRVTGSRTTHLPYGGPALRSRQRCWWTVEVWDEAGNRANPGPTAFWEMGLLSAEDWGGGWIGLGEPEGPSPRMPVDELPVGAVRAVSDMELPPARFLRTSFRVERLVRSARLYITARGVYEARLNGQRVGDDILAPGWTDYRKRIAYQTHDVGDLLVDGENALGAILGTGWYAGHIGWGGVTRHYGARPELLARLVVEYEDGTRTEVVSDESWRVTLGPIRYSDLLMGEHYDARRDLHGWDRPRYDEATWQSVTVVARDNTPLVADRAEPVRVVEDITPVAIVPRPDGNVIVDLGQNMTGWVRLRATGPAGTAIGLRFAEVLDRDGGLYTANLRSARQADTFVLAGTGKEETWEPRFTFHGFRYVEVSGYPGPVAPGAITGRVVESATAEAGTFACSDDLINRIQRNIVWGQRGNFLSIPTDCPQRDERLGWLADAQIFAPTACRNREVGAFFTKWLDDVADGQSAAGAFPDVAPRLIDEADGAPAWGDGGVIVPWVVHRAYGDTRILEDHYAGMVRWLDYLEAANPDLRWEHNRGNDFGDWLSVGADTPKDVLATAYFAHDAQVLAKIARVLGREADAVRFATLFDRIAAAFNAAYVASDGRIAGDTQTCYVLALRFGLLPAGLRDAAAGHLVADIERRGGHLSTGFVGVGHLLPVLSAIGRVDLAYRLVQNEDYPSWGHMVRNGATTIWERWDGWTEEQGFQDPGMNSFNHYSFGSLGDWLFATVAGLDLDPEVPGYERVVIRPRPGGGLTWARADHRSLRGPISCAWRIADGAIALDLTMPPNTNAEVHVPTRDPSAVVEGAHPAGHAESVRVVRENATTAVFAVGSGTYSFRAPWSD